MTQDHDADGVKTVKVHLLDCGPEKYGDALLLELGKVTVLVDGAHPADTEEREGHPGIPDQLAELFGGQPPYKPTLLIVTHAHEDHIGCLPALVAKKIIAPTWALVVDPDHGWGKSSAIDSAKDPRTRQVLAGLREEPFTPDKHRTVEQFLVDAAGLEQKYRGMLKALEDAGTEVVRYGTRKHEPLIDALKASGVELEILGPSFDQLAQAAELLSVEIDGWAESLDAIFTTDQVDVTAAEAYQRLFDDTDAGGRAGHLVNLQSLVTAFTYRKKKMLLTGDMQLAAPGTGNAVIKTEVRAMRDRIEALAPFDFAKLAHHGSWNGFNSDLLDEIKPTTIGICAGENSIHHPSKDVLDLLAAHTDELTWMRTDRQRRCMIDLSKAEPRYKPEKGLNDPRRNDLDTVQVPQQPPKPPAEKPGGKPPVVPPEVVKPAEERTPEPITVEAYNGEMVEVVARIPMRRVQVAITVAVTPDASTQVAIKQPTSHGAQPLDPGAGPHFFNRPSLTPGDGRDLSGLVFLTNRDRLAARIGAPAAANVIEALGRVHGARVISDLAGADAADVAARARAHWNGNRPRGIVLVGGHEVIPSQRVDALPTSIRERMEPFDDPDDFIVWSDDVYAMLDDDGIPDVPVSRIPDAEDPTFLLNALNAKSAAVSSRFGIRNLARPFAVDVYTKVPGQGPSQPDSSSPRGRGNDGVPALEASDALYLMLHGFKTDGGSFAGEDEQGLGVECVNIGSVPKQWSGTVFAGCCWGALTTKRPAVSGVTPSRQVDESLALTFLSRGALAFVGCTGAHYSPREPPYRYFGRPLHDAFWTYLRQGRSPAESLFQAKRDYVKSFPFKPPNGNPTLTSTAIEYKIWRQFTCLGLGW